MTEPNDHRSYSPSEIATRQVGGLRLAIGAVQGLTAWALLELVPPNYGYEINENAARQLWWSERHPMLFAAMVLITAFVPVIALAETGRMRPQRMGIYLAAAAAALAALACYDVWRDPVELMWAGRNMPRIWPSPGLLLPAGVGLFIVNQLIEHRERTRGFYADYAAYFDDSSIRCVQLILSLIFTLLVWGILKLGGALFGLIHLDWFGQMVDHNWFRCPALAIAFAASIHITDVHPGMIQGMRNLGLTLLSWLLPLVVVLACAFLIALLFTGLAPLWATRSAASILMSAAAVTIILLNAAFKDGKADNAPGLPVRWASRIGGPLVLIFVLLAFYALLLRVGQYGLTEQRVLLGAVVAVGLVYGAGYSWAALDRGGTLRRFERVNITAAIAVVAVLILVRTPLADPARLAVDGQMSRLRAGKVSPDKFDYGYLRFKSGRYGTDALAALTRDKDARIAARAKTAAKTKWESWSGDATPAATEPALSHATIYPHGAKLPEDFLSARRNDHPALARCLDDGSPCDIIRLKSADRDDELWLIYQPTGKAGNFVVGEVGFATLVAHNAAGRWESIGRVGNLACPGVLGALRKGEAASVRPQYDDLLAAGIRLPITPETRDQCPPTPPPAAKPPEPADARAPAMTGPAFGQPAGL